MKIEPKEYIIPEYREIMEYVEKHNIPFYIELFDDCYNKADRGDDKWLKIITTEPGETFFRDWMADREIEWGKRIKRELRRKRKKDRE